MEWIIGSIIFVVANAYSLFSAIESKDHPPGAERAFYTESRLELGTTGYVGTPTFQLTADTGSFPAGRHAGTVSTPLTSEVFQGTVFIPVGSNVILGPTVVVSPGQGSTAVLPDPDGSSGPKEKLQANVTSALGTWTGVTLRFYRTGKLGSGVYFQGMGGFCRFQMKTSVAALAVSGEGGGGGLRMGVSRSLGGSFYGDFGFQGMGTYTANNGFQWSAGFGIGFLF